MVLIGGINTTPGPVIGAAFVSMFPALVNINPWLQEMVYGALSILAVTLLPGGVMSLLKRVAALGGGGASEAEPAVSASDARKRRSRRASSASSPPKARARTQAGVLEPEYAVECRGIQFSYGTGLRVLRDVDLAVKRGPHPWTHRPERIGQEHACQRDRRAAPAARRRHPHQGGARRRRFAQQAREARHAQDLSGGRTRARIDADPERDGRPVRPHAAHRSARGVLAASAVRPARPRLDGGPIARGPRDGRRAGRGSDGRSATCRTASSN